MKATVLHTIGTPYTKYGRWYIKVRYNTEKGRVGITDLMFDTKEECSYVEQGYRIVV